MDKFTPLHRTNATTIRQSDARWNLREFLIWCCSDENDTFDSSIERHTGVIIFAMRKPHMMCRTVNFEFSRRWLPRPANW